jgi:hypothetical protein
MKRITPDQRTRRGAAVAEAAIVMSVFLLILLGSIDLALVVLRDNTLADAARQLARTAIVRGERAEAIATPWGPEAYTGTAGDDTAYAAVIRPILVTLDPETVQIRLDWPDGGNADGDRVEVTLSTEHHSLLPSLVGAEPYRLHATSTMPIEH